MIEIKITEKQNESLVRALRYYLTYVQPIREYDRTRLLKVLPKLENSINKDEDCE